ncbi:MAG: hypothetical protein HYS86_04650 [Candidatus Chisholmbacteria bacterium]|nr:hypothetical protein [Candidatus Chisholmbacteria bacterium]
MNLRLTGLLAGTALALTLYSFSQVDLNLTLSAHPAYQSFQTQLTTLGYFHRPLSTAIYLLIVLLLAIGYLLLAIAVRKRTIKKRQLWILIGLVVILLLPSYPAFSHDVFNYLFDARIATKYGLSPWHYKALDFPADDWIRFMRWTHRPSVYPPVWIGLSLIPSFLGFGKFIVTLGLFKLLAAISYLGSSLLMVKIAEKLKKSQPLTYLALFALNPLVIIESLVNAHMEIVMIFFALLSFYFILRGKSALGWVSLIASVGIKFMTFYLGLLLLKGKNYLRYTVWLGTVILIAFIAWYGFQPWYLLWILPFALLIKGWERQLYIIASTAVLFWNVPLVLLGDFDLPHWTTRLIYVVIPLGLSVVYLAAKNLTFKSKP